MRQIATNTFTDGMVKDLNPLITPTNCLTDCLNGTLITYNGNEFSLQNDMGNVKLPKSVITKGYVPLGMKEYGGIVYMALYNPEENKCEIGSIPSPSYEAVPTEREGEKWVGISSDSFVTNDAENGNTFNQSIVKLFEFEQLTLNPGDQYGIMYQITKGSDVLNKPNLYSIDLYAIDQDNKQHKIDDPVYYNAKAIGSDQYVYLDKALQSILALKVQLNEIDWFETVCYETNKNNERKLNFILNWKNKLQNADIAEDDLIVRGVRVECEGKTTQYWEDASTHDQEKVRVRHEIEVPSAEYAEGERLDFTLTPYDQYHYIEALQRKLSVTIGKSNVFTADNMTYKYKYSKSNNSLRLDFTMDTMNMVDPYMIVEFYDVWSDFSVMVPVEDINPAGLNTLFLDTAVEPVDTVFNTATWGGVDSTLLYEYKADTQIKTIYQPWLSNTAKRNQVLRENNLYVVRISAIDMDGVEEIERSAYNTIYKLLIINENYNTWYDQVNLSGITEGVDFNSKNLNTSYSFKFDSTLITESLGNVDKTTEDNLTAKTGDSYYAYSIDKPLSFSGNQSYVDTYTLTNRYRLDTEVTSSSTPVGMVYKVTTEVADVLDNMYITDDDADIHSEKTMTAKNGNITIELKTEREVRADILGSTNQNKVATQTIPYRFNYVKSDTSAAMYRAARTAGSKILSGFVQYPGDDNAGPYVLSFGKIDVDGEIMVKLCDIEYEGNKSVKSDGFPLDITFCNWGNISCDLFDKSTEKRLYKMQASGTWFLVTKASGGDAMIVLTDNQYEAIRALDSLRVSRVKERTNYMYVYDDVSYSPESTTSLTGNLKVSLRSIPTVIQRIQGVNYTKTVDVINKLTELTGASISANYFSLEASEVSSEMTVDAPNMEISAKADATVRNALLNSDAKLKSEQAQLFTSFKYDDLQVYSEDDAYPNQAKRFRYVEDGNSSHFEYIPRNRYATRWAYDAQKDVDGPDYDDTIFDQL